MKNILLASLMMIAASAAFANSAAEFEGVYDLVEGKNDGDAFCFERIIIRTEEDGMLALYRDNTAYFPMIRAELNGAARPVSGSHGEGMSQYKGKESVSLKNGILTFSYQGITNFAGIPVSRETDISSFQWTKGKKYLKASREKADRPLASFGKNPTALCAYEKQ